MIHPHIKPNQSVKRLRDFRSVTEYSSKLG